MPVKRSKKAKKPKVQAPEHQIPMRKSQRPYGIVRGVTRSYPREALGSNRSLYFGDGRWGDSGRAYQTTLSRRSRYYV